ncbi:MAG: DUF4399 domain-containing protein [Anaerolineae bacterium]|nr:DUF4399 domain-containing protein [Anaerolineae bacterium]HRA18964.1 DUF4399 domain-containing protein [Anaerolineae bacterium]
MTVRKLWIPVVTVLLMAASLAACAPEEAAAPADEESAGQEQPAADAGMGATATVGFRDLADGAEVTSPVKVCMEVTGVGLEPSGEVKAGYGHNHVLVNPSADEVAAITAGTMTSALVKDETHIHIGDGTDCSELTLTPGSYELMAVVGDGAHVPLNPPVVSQISITVK